MHGNQSVKRTSQYEGAHVSVELVTTGWAKEETINHVARKHRVGKDDITNG